ncbi:MAG: ABC transporter ATP-binding protein [Blastocatellia bacterium]|nr:ABC transporter ATP-binding protein [Blastocatellia bacterium]
MINNLAVQISDLKKTYGAVAAVKGINLDVHVGEIFGLIGPDGAGKTSTFQILGGVMQATSGTAEMFGVNARDARPFVGYLTQSFSLYQDLSVQENIDYLGELRLVPRDQIRERGMRYLRMFDMDRFTARLAGRLSGGMKQKLALTCALIAEPKILLLDEPTTGVDPVSRREFWDALAQLSAEGMTIIVATPYLDEAERCHRVALMFDGEIHQVGTPKELKEGLGLQRLEVRAADLRGAEDVLSATTNIHDAQRFGDRLDVMVRDSVVGERAVREALHQAENPIIEIRSGVPTLENTFVSVLRNLHPEQPIAPFPVRREFRSRKAGAVAIGATTLNKRFGEFHAVKNITLNIQYGEIYGLLGANGAGKTTTIKMLCGLLEATSGEMTLADEKGGFRSSSVRQRIGYMSQKFSLYDDLTIGENLDFFAGVYGIPRADREAKKQWVLGFAELDGKAEQMVGSLPGGWKQRVAFGAAIMHEPSVLFLDEPTSGVDPIARRQFWQMINQLADRGVAILITTHYLEEAEQCNRLGLMVAGELVAEGTPTGIKAEQGGHLLEVYPSEPQRATSLLKSEMESWRVAQFGDRVHVIVDEEASAELARITARLQAASIQVLRAEEETYSLEDVFIVVVEKARATGKYVGE